jgi:hypothetical protein
MGVLFLAVDSRRPTEGPPSTRATRLEVTP